MLDVIQEIEMFDLIIENREKRTHARAEAIKALEGVVDGTVSEDDYNMAVAEYSDVLKEIEASERNHLLIGTEDETNNNKEL